MSIQARLANVYTACWQCINFFRVKMLVILKGEKAFSHAVETVWIFFIAYGPDFPFTYSKMKQN